MERVNEIRADIAENASHITNKMLLQDLRAISQLFTVHCSSGLSDEDFYRFSIIKNAINTKNTDSLRRIEIIVSRSLGGIKPPCAGTKRGVAYDGSTKQGRGRKTIQGECRSHGRK